MSESKCKQIRNLRRLASLATVAILLTQPSLAKAESLSDPTQPPGEPAALASIVEDPLDTRAPLVLHAVFFAEGRRIAIINDQRVSIDDVIQSARVTEIERRRVSLIREGEAFHLELVTQNVKREIEKTLDDAAVITSPTSEQLTPAVPAAVSSDHRSLDSVAPATALLDSLAPTREGNEP